MRLRTFSSRSRATSIGSTGRAVRVLLQHDGADERAGEVVRDEPADDARLQDVLAHAREALGRGLEIGGDHVAGFDAVLDHLEVAHVRREQRLHAPAVDAIHHDDFVRRPLQRVEELRL